ncbi:MAG: hypothetical protein DLM53_06385 [Candidatus Eremiobacter antarcticus]|nr:tetratricopeptide repeat protein [Candidatus Eremiobacteraeota bacterium]MBC5807135.1 tetratricopeptide repeat protein [Candidatus Eremiobacteraeota bacterium]PZR62440.1 MAG: hypothetical protein DLM53_06385 [Candidatus Eremiobacter sp. RRmetagenome_bin22]
MLRKVLGPPAGHRTFIETVPSRGYRFVVPVKSSEQPSPPNLRSEVRPAIVRRAGWAGAALALVAMLMLLHSSSSRSFGTSENGSAQKDYLLGRYYWNQRTPPALQTSLRYFQAAVRESPSSALAYSGLADSHTALGIYVETGKRKQREFWIAQTTARHAIELDTGSAEAHASLGYALWLSGRGHAREAAAQFQESIRLNGEYAPARQWYSWMLYSQDKLNEAYRQMATAHDIDPVSPIINYALGYQLYYLRRYKEASAQWHQTMAMSPANVQSYLGAGLADAQLGDKRDALRELRSALRLNPADPDAMGSLAHLYASSKQPKDAQRLLERMGKMRPVPAMYMAVVRETMGQHEEAVKWLAVAKKQPDFEDLAMDPQMDGLLRSQRARG